MAGGVLPVARHRGRIYFLFGREAHDSKWSDFGGGKERKEKKLTGKLLCAKGLRS